MELKIEKGIPIPEKHDPKIRALDIIYRMVPGDSIYIPMGILPDANAPRMMHGRIHTLAKNRIKDGQFTVRMEGNGYRLWRVA